MNRNILFQASLLTEVWIVPLLSLEPAGILTEENAETPFERYKLPPTSSPPVQDNG